MAGIDPETVTRGSNNDQMLQATDSPGSMVLGMIAACRLLTRADEQEQISVWFERRLIVDHGFLHSKPDGTQFDPGLRRIQPGPLVRVSRGREPICS